MFPSRQRSDHPVSRRKAPVMANHFSMNSRLAWLLRNFLCLQAPLSEELSLIGQQRSRPAKIPAGTVASVVGRASNGLKGSVNIASSFVGRHHSLSAPTATTELSRKITYDHIFYEDMNMCRPPSQGRYNPSLQPIQMFYKVKLGANKNRCFCKQWLLMTNPFHISWKPEL